MLQSLPWDCQLSTRFLDHNAGCGRAVSTAITWFFEHEESGIILEDDCVPAPDFLPFCSELLARYASAPQVMSIRGSRFSLPVSVDGSSYQFSRFFDCHGWAAWRRSWRHYRFKLRGWRERFTSHHPPLHGLAPASARCWAKRFDQAALSESPRNWAHQWSLEHFIRDGLSIVPKHNLISNIGAGVDATNCKRGFLWENVPLGSVSWPLTGPPCIAPDERLDRAHEHWRNNHRPWPLRKAWQFINRWQLGSARFRRGGID